MSRKFNEDEHCIEKKKFVEYPKIAIEGFKIEKIINENTRYYWIRVNRPLVSNEKNVMTSRAEIKKEEEC